MKNNLVKLILSILTVFSVAFSTEFSVQGVLRDPLGRTVDDGQYSVTFKIYDVASSGSALWTEVHGSVDIQHGIFTELLGGTTSMEDLAFNKRYWIGISVEGGVEMSPRTQLTTSPYSKSVFGTDNVFPSIGRIGVGTLVPEAAFHIENKNDETDILLIKDASNNEQVKVANDGTLSVPDGIFGNGVLGVGTQAPEALTHIVGGDGADLLILDADGSAQVKVANDGTLTVPDGIFGNGVLGVGTQDPTAALHILSNGDDDKLRIDDENGDPQVQVNSDGYLGINNPTLDGTSVIGAPLSVSGNLRLYNDGVLLFTDGTQLASANFGGSATGVTSPSTATINALSSDGNIALNVGSADKLVVTSTLTDISTSLTVSGAYAGFGAAYSNVALNARNVNDHTFAFLVEDSDENIDFAVMLDGTVSAKRDFEVHDSTTLGGTLDVTGATTVGGTLDVTGQTTLEGVLSANGAYAGFGQAYTNVALTLRNVNDLAYAFLVQDSDENIDFAVMLDGTVSAKRDFEVGGATTLGGTLDVTGVTTLEGVLKANGAYAGFGQVLTNVALTLRNVNDHAFAFLIKDSDGNNDFEVYLDGTVKAKRDFKVDGSTTLGGTLDVDGVTTINGAYAGFGQAFTNAAVSIKNVNNLAYAFVILDSDQNIDFSVLLNGTVSNSNGNGTVFPDRVGSNDEPENSLNNIMALDIVKYDSRGYKYGLVIDQVDAIYPELVNTSSGLETGDPYKSVNMTGVSAITIQAIKELKQEKDKEVQAIKEDYDKKLSSILARIEELENQ
jgi:cytoskeletal protein CcmA (bactofilin family)